MLYAKGDADDCYAADQAENQVDDGYFPPSEQNPDQIHHDRDASGLAGSVDYLTAEGPEGVIGELEELQPEGYADDGDAHQQTHQYIDDGDKQASQNKPEYVSQRFHSLCQICKDMNNPYICIENRNLYEVSQ